MPLHECSHFRRNIRPRRPWLHCFELDKEAEPRGQELLIQRIQSLESSQLSLQRFTQGSVACTRTVDLHVLTSVVAVHQLRIILCALTFFIFIHSHATNCCNGSHHHTPLMEFHHVTVGHSRIWRLSRWVGIETIRTHAALDIGQGSSSKIVPMKLHHLHIRHAGDCRLPELDLMAAILTAAAFQGRLEYLFPPEDHVALPFNESIEFGTVMRGRN